MQLNPMILTFGKYSTAAQTDHSQRTVCGADDTQGEGDAVMFGAFAGKTLAASDAFKSTPTPACILQ